LEKKHAIRVQIFHAKIILHDHRPDGAALCGGRRLDEFVGPKY
jgi:hypothetical protein